MFENKMVNPLIVEDVIHLSNDGLEYIQEKITSQLPAYQNRIKRLVQQFGSVEIASVNINQLFSGLRGANLLPTDISALDPLEGIRMRGYSIPQLIAKLPKKEGHEYPVVGGLYYLLLVGEIPTLDEAILMEHELYIRSQLPEYLIQTMRAVPKDTHPMTMFSLAILSLQKESIFSREYERGLKKQDYWKVALEDSLNLTAKLPSIAAFIYNLKYGDGEYVEPSPDLDWSANFAHMIGLGHDANYRELCRLYFLLHADHESGNVSAHTAHLVGSTLSDVYYACSAGMNGLAGPLHGLANQGCLNWLLDVRERFGETPSKSDIETYAWETLNSGKVIPGFGHAVLRRTDPRYLALFKFAEDNLENNAMQELVKNVYESVPGILMQLGKVKNPWPNVDAISGALQYSFGVDQAEFYTVLFGVSRIMGLTAQTVWSRAIRLPIERPKSITTDALEALVAEAAS